MRRKGRDLERLVSILEGGLDSGDVVVTSPDFVVDQVTGTKREVDASVRKGSTTGEILTIVECRDRKRTEDVAWIEQLATKVRDLGAPRVIAVSSAGFATGAQLKATYHGIELRTIEDISNENLQNWIIPDSLMTIVGRHHIGGITLLSDDPTLDDMHMHFDANTKYFVHSNGNSFTANDLFNMIPNLSSYYPPHDNQARRIETLLIDLRETPLSFRTDTNLVKVDGIELKVELWNDIQQVPSMKMFAYRDEEQRLIGGSKFPLTLGGIELNLVTHTNAPIENGTTVKFTLQSKKEHQ